MKHFMLLVPIAFLMMTLVGCATPNLQREQTASLSVGASVGEVDQLFKPVSADIEHTFDANGIHYLARHYALETGVRSEMTVICTPACMPIAVNVPVTDPYAVVFKSEDKRLIAWGTVEELSKHPDDAISGIMPFLKNSYEKALAAKKNSRGSRK